jgi:hypothetical protein
VIFRVEYTVNGEDRIAMLESNVDLTTEDGQLETIFYMSLRHWGKRVSVSGIEVAEEEWNEAGNTAKQIIEKMMCN